MKFPLLIALVISGFMASGQKIVEIKFNLYTDSLLKGFHNYINVEGRLPDGRWLPLMSDAVIFSSNAGIWEGNEILVDSSYTADSVVVTAVLRSNPKMKLEQTIFLRKRGFDIPLKTEEELLEEMRKGRKKPSGLTFS